MEEEIKKVEIGKVSHYYGKLNVAVIDLKGELEVGDEILIEGGESKVRQKVKSMQIEHEKIQNAAAGDSVGLKVEGKVRDGYKVYKIVG